MLCLKVTFDIWFDSYEEVEHGIIAYILISSQKACMASEDFECIMILLLCFFVICLTTTRIFVHRRKKVMEQHERRL